ncbi:hypothetical protein CHI07_10030 [Paenibacillus sp. 7884-2]|nr:hypothetical protein CHI07_10030 [Paenibacillus sp. 7884-2]
MTDEPCETVDIKKLQNLDRETKYIVSSEFRTGLSLTIIYFIFIISVPVMNWYKPDWAFTKLVGGMSASWFLTSIIAMVMAFVIAYVHTRLYERWEKKVQALKPSAGNEEEKETVV